MKTIYKLLLFNLLVLSHGGFSQTSNWTESPYLKAFKVIIPDSVHLSLPSPDPYTIGFFVYGSHPTLLKNVGKATYTLGQKIEIQLSYDALGDYGYRNGDRLISLIYNSNTAEIFGLEFNYDKGKNTFKFEDSTVVTGIASSTWMNFIDRTIFCRFEKEIVLKVPYGVKHHLVASTGVKIDSSGVYPKILLDSMAIGTNYSFEFFYPEVKFTHALNGFTFVDFPIQYLNSKYEICPGDTISISSNYLNGDLFRSKNQFGSYDLTKQGTYFFPMFYKPTGCSVMDTVIVNLKAFPLNKINTSHYICPGDIVDVPIIDNANQLTREIISAPDFKLITPGKYIFKASSLISGCVLNDTIVVKLNNVNCQSVTYPELVDPLNGNGLVLPLEEKVIICNAAMQKVIELKTPTIWYGKDYSGALLPVGVYYVIHENGSSNSVSIIY